MFVVAQIAGALAALAVSKWLFRGVSKGTATP
jgi:hypothetical protein